VLELESAVKRFGQVTALDGCSFSARPGRLTGFLGPNGAGKTTAMRAVFGLVELDAGAVRWRGAPVTATERVRFGYMPEERGLYPRMRVREQLLYLGQLCGRTRQEAGRVADRWLERLGVADRASDRLDTLSHGNQQRVQLIAALVNEPDLLVPQRFLEIRHRGPAPDYSRIAAAHVIEAKNGRVRLRIDRPADLDAVVAAACRDGDLVSLTYQPPTLSELFRQAVPA